MKFNERYKPLYQNRAGLIKGEEAKRAGMNQCE